MMMLKNQMGFCEKLQQKNGLPIWGGGDQRENFLRERAKFLRGVQRYCLEIGYRLTRFRKVYHYYSNTPLTLAGPLPTSVYYDAA